MFIIFSFLSFAQAGQEEVTNAMKDYADALYDSDSGMIHQSTTLNLLN